MPSSPDLQRQRLEILRKEYDSELRTLKKEFDTGEWEIEISILNSLRFKPNKISEESYIVRQHDKQMEDLQDILFALEQGFSDKEVVARMEFQSMRDEIKNKVTYVKVFISFINLSRNNGVPIWRIDSQNYKTDMYYSNLFNFDYF